MNHKTYTLILATLLIVVQLKAQENFVLEATLIGFENGTKFIISPALPNMNWDRDRDTEIYLENGKFRFEYKIEEPTKFSLRALPKIPPDNPADFEYVYFWAENKPMKLIGKKGELQFSDFSGSEIQDQYEEYVKIGKERQLINQRIRDSVFTYNLSEEARTPLRKIRDENQSLVEKSQLDFIYDNPNHLWSLTEVVFYINFIPEKLSKTRTIEFYQSLSDDFKSSIYGKQIYRFIGKKNIGFKELKIGDKPYLFSLPDSSGTKLPLATMRGKIILIDFWASGCGPCRSEHKNYFEVYQKFQPKGFEILSISQDQSKRLWLKAMQKDNMVWKSVWDANRDVTLKYHVTGIPANYLINKDGIIIDKDLTGEKLTKKLEALFNEN
jgi:peroxiredoxin